MTPIEIRDDFIFTLTHIERILARLEKNTGKAKEFDFADFHKLAEGLFLSAWSHWEEFTRTLLFQDLATDSKGILRKDIKKFRTKLAPSRLAERILNHPDHPEKFIDWSEYNFVVTRAKEFLGTGNRLTSTSLPRISDLSHLKRIRNAIAHKSDKAWVSFKSLVTSNPFNLPSTKFITPGRFLVAHKWNGNTVLKEALSLFRTWATHLVP